MKKRCVYRWVGLRVALLGAVLTLMACSSQPPTPDWQMNAQGAAQKALAAYLSGNARVEQLEWDHARAEVARTGRADLLARLELMRCAAQRASAWFRLRAPGAPTVWSCLRPTSLRPWGLRPALRQPAPAAECWGGAGQCRQRVSRTVSQVLAAPLSTIAAIPAIDQLSGTWRYTSQPASMANPICEYRNGAIVTGVVRA